MGHSCLAERGAGARTWSETANSTLVHRTSSACALYTFQIFSPTRPCTHGKLTVTGTWCGRSQGRCHCGRHCGITRDRAGTGPRAGGGVQGGGEETAQPPPCLGTAVGCEGLLLGVPWSGQGTEIRQAGGCGRRWLTVGAGEAGMAPGEPVSDQVRR